MRVLITGASGQIGTNLALRLLAEGHGVWGVDIRPNTWTQAFEVVPFDLAAIGAPASLDAALRRFGKPDAVVHLAAHAKVHQLTRLPHMALDNVAMLQHTLEYCRLHQLPVVFSSSREVYGNVRRVSTRESDADLAHIASPYAASKMAGEAMVRAYGACYGLPWMIFRLSNVYGRYDDDLARLERVIPLFARSLRAGEPVTVFGAGKVLDFTHVDDCVDGLMRGLSRLLDGRVRDAVFNLARGEGHTLGTMAGWLAEILQVPIDLRFAPARVGEVTHYVADITLARSSLGFAPQTGLRDGLRKAVLGD